MLYWISWYQYGVDYRPLRYPPNAGVLGWWCSGQSLDAAILCALVKAYDAAAARKIILKDWPEAEQWRFCESKDYTFRPGNRFPLSPWMKKRIERLHKD